MRRQDLDRERACFDLLREVSGYDVVLIGGYAVSAYGLPRFSVDLDLVVEASELPGIHATLRGRGFAPLRRWDGGGVFASRSERWTPGVGRPAVAVDLFIGGVADRVSGITRPFGELRQASSRRTIRGLDPASVADALVPNRETLLALKLQVGRLVDLRDIAVLAGGPFDKAALAAFLSPVPRDLLATHAQRLLSAIETREFRNSLKGVYMLDDRSFERFATGARGLCLWILRELRDRR